MAGAAAGGCACFAGGGSDADATDSLRVRLLFGLGAAASAAAGTGFSVGFTAAAGFASLDAPALPLARRTDSRCACRSTLSVLVAHFSFPDSFTSRAADAVKFAAINNA